MRKTYFKTENGALVEDAVYGDMPCIYWTDNFNQERRSYFTGLVNDPYNKIISCTIKDEYLFPDGVWRLSKHWTICADKTKYRWLYNAPSPDKLYHIDFDPYIYENVYKEVDDVDENGNIIYIPDPNFKTTNDDGSQILIDNPWYQDHNIEFEKQKNTVLGSVDYSGYTNYTITGDEILPFNLEYSGTVSFETIYGSGTTDYNGVVSYNGGGNKDELITLNYTGSVGYSKLDPNFIIPDLKIPITAPLIKKQKTIISDKIKKGIKPGLVTNYDFFVAQSGHGVNIGNGIVMGVPIYTYIFQGIIEEYNIDNYFKI